MKTNTKPVEYRLIEREVGEIDALLERAEHALSWNSDGIWNYMEKLRCLVLDLSMRVSGGRGASLGLIASKHM